MNHFKKIKEKIKIPKEKPFENDKLDREKHANSLSAIVKSYFGPLVLSVNGPWGFGKTTFLEMWKVKLENEGHPCIYFNAWENDFSDKPLIGFMGEIDEFIQSHDKKSTEWNQINKSWFP